MSNAHHARRFLQCILPLELLQELDLSTLRILPNNDTDDQLHEHFSDLIVEVRRNDSQQLVLYLVLEHKSYRDDMSSWQVLKYLVHRADRFLREGRALACIIPLVIYNGRLPWVEARALHEIFDVPEELRAMFPQFRVPVLDVARMADKIFHGSAAFVASALTFKNILQPEFAEKFGKIITPLADNMLSAGRTSKPRQSTLNTLLRYASSQLPQSQIRKIQSQIFRGPRRILEKAMPTAAQFFIAQAKRAAVEEGLELGIQRGLQKGLQKGLAKGLQQGHVIGEIHTLQRLLKRPLTPASELRQETLTTLRGLAKTLRRDFKAANSSSKRA
jgi:hypothetical protein